MKTDQSLDMLIAGDLFIGENTAVTLDENLKVLLSGYDLTCVNLEGPLGRLSANFKQKKAGPNLCQDEVRCIKLLKELDVDLVTLANNHIMDYGVEGLKSTLKKLQSMGIAAIGAVMKPEQAIRSHIIEKNGVKIGILNAAENGYGCVSGSYAACGYAYLFDKRLSEELKRLKYEENCDNVIGIFHAGAEDIEHPLPEWRYVYRYFLEMGLDMVIAHHPHVLQGMELYKEKPIFYSIGNFIWASEKEQNMPNIGGLIEVHADKRKPLSWNIKFMDDRGRLFDEKGCLAEIQYQTLCSELQKEDADYEKKMNEICKQRYHELYENYIFEMLGLLNSHTGSRLKRWKYWLRNLRYLLFHKDRINKIMVQHNLEIETNRWLCLRAIHAEKTDI